MRSGRKAAGFGGDAQIDTSGVKEDSDFELDSNEDFELDAKARW